MRKIALDGPSGAGKSTIAKALAEKLGYIYVDTGAMYRCVGLYALRTGTDPKNVDDVTAKLPEIKLDLRYENGEQNMYLNGENVTGLIRTSEVSAYASSVSAIPSVRAFLLDAQRNMALEHDVIMDGRDIGTVIFPDADVKFFVTVSVEARARRRQRDLAAKGENLSIEEVKLAIEERDRQDSTRAIAPAVPAPDAIMLDNSGDFDEVINKALAIIEEKIR